jgi:molybdate transport system permease protein
MPSRKRSPLSTFSFWKLSTLPLLLFIFIPLAALFLRTSPADLWANLRQTQVLQAIRLSLVTSPPCC